MKTAVITPNKYIKNDLARPLFLEKLTNFFKLLRIDTDTYCSFSSQAPILTQVPDPSAQNSFFQIGALCFKVSMP